jgi:hypothetical protein
MKWLSASDVGKLELGSQEPQTLLLFCGHGDLAACLPVAPRLVWANEGSATPTKQWVALINDRPVVIEQDPFVHFEGRHVVVVLTPYVDSAAEAEWSPLRDLSVLPEPIHPTRPLFIQSRSTSRDHVVCRPNPRGWSDAVYRAASRAEAEDLLEYLHRDPWNRPCFIGSVEHTGLWTVVGTGGRESRILGCYPDVDSALRLASRISDDNPDDVVVVKDASAEGSRNEYRISHGRLEGGSADRIRVD